MKITFRSTIYNIYRWNIALNIHFAVVVLEHRWEWRFLELSCENILPQTWHPYGLTPVCTPMCLVKSPFRPKDFPQCSHLWDISTVWVSLCCFKLLLRANDFPHTSQEKGFSPVCVRMWFVRLCLCVHVYGQRGQENGCSPVWMSVCLFNWPFTAKLLPQWEHI